MSEQQLAVKQEALQAVSAETQAIMQMIEQIALNPQADVEKLRAVMDMKMQMFNRGAEIEFNAAMSLTQAEIEPVSRTAQNKQTNSKYAKLENIIKECSPIWTRHGFALSYDTADCPLPDHYRVTCEVSHRAGHSKNYHMDLPIDNAGINGTKNKTGMHGAGSTISYGRRYIACNVFNIAITDEDTDGAARNQRPAEQPKSQRQPISDSRLAAAIQKISTGEATIGRLLNNHTLTDSQKKVVKAQFPQVEL